MTMLRDQIYGECDTIPLLLEDGEGQADHLLDLLGRDRIHLVDLCRRGFPGRPDLHDLHRGFAS